MGDQHHRRIGLGDGRVEGGDPALRIGTLPVVLFDPTGIRQTALSVGLPMLGAGALPTGKDEIAGHGGAPRGRGASIVPTVDPQEKE